MEFSYVADAPRVEYASPEEIKIEWSSHLFEQDDVEEKKDKEIKSYTLMYRLKEDDTPEFKSILVKPERKDQELFKAVSPVLIREHPDHVIDMFRWCGVRMHV